MVVGMNVMIKFFKKLFGYTSGGDMSKHRVHTTKYEDLCQ